MLNFFFGKIYTLNIPHGATPVMIKIINFHEKCLIVIVFVLVIVFILLIYKVFKNNRGILKLENTNFEIA